MAFIVRPPRRGGGGGWGGRVWCSVSRVRAHKVQDRRVQVVDVDLVLDRREAELVGRAVGHAALDAAAGQPHREAPWLWSRPWSRPFAPSAVGVRPNSPPQMTSVSSSRPAGLQVAEQRGDRPVAVLGELGAVPFSMSSWSSHGWPLP